MTATERKTILDRAFELGFEYEKTYRGCAQCVFAALQDTFALRSPETDAIFKSATGLAGGVGAEGDGHCGAYAGGVMMIGYLLGRDRENFGNFAATRARNFGMVRRLHEKFIEEYGSVTCHQIHRKIMGRPFYIRDPEEMKKFDDAGAHTDKCTSVVGDATRWTAEILLDEGLVSS